jgi:hypothetical protein
MSDDNAQTCPGCDGQLVEIDHFGQHLIGCVQCNKWKRADGKSLGWSANTSKPCLQACRFELIDLPWAALERPKGPALS